ncbi:COMM domain-containing protein 8 [Aplysia californica]|uniref:COMM domain-containing protein 8 n=1 Tax=Aplysia californica TaxID=6500 RepID=A0ABM0JSQ1_APLCA|nr:COMM domain-containing protein 8 [Aplysia californica]
MADEKWESAFPVLCKTSSADIGNVCHAVAESFCQDDVISADAFLSTWTLEEWWQVRSVLTDIMRSAVGKGWSKEKISEELGSLDEPYKKVLIDVINVHEASLRKKLLLDTTAVSHAVLSDFDWKLQLAMSSDKLAQLQELLVQLDLDVREAGGDRKRVILEMDKSELGRLISSLEACGKSVQQMTTS